MGTLREHIYLMKYSLLINLLKAGALLMALCLLSILGIKCHLLFLFTSLCIEVIVLEHFQPCIIDLR